VARYCVDRLLQRALGDELDHRVDCEDDVMAVARTIRAVAADEIDAAPRIAQQRDFAGCAAHLFVERVLDAGEAVAIETDVADDVRRERGARIRTPVRLEKVDPGQFQLARFGGHFERQLPRDPREAAVAAQLRFDLARGQADAGYAPATSPPRGDL
jgi:hypothetical protein